MKFTLPHHWFVHIPVSSEEIEVLGIPIGSDKSVADATLQMAERGKDLCDKLIGFTNLQSSMLLLRHCHVGRLDHLARSIRPNSLSHAASIHDGLTKKTFCSLLCCNSITSSQ